MKKIKLILAALLVAVLMTSCDADPKDRAEYMNNTFPNMELYAATDHPSYVVVAVDTVSNIMYVLRYEWTWNVKPSSIRRLGTFGYNKLPALYMPDNPTGSITILNRNGVAEYSYERDGTIIAYNSYIEAAK